MVEYFGLGAHEVITRRQPVKAAKRGYYLIDEAGITLPDFFSESVRYMNTEQAASLLVCPRMLDGNEIIDISRQIIGDVIARSRLYQDVFSFRGIREYTPADPLSAVNWKASARTGDYMVNIRDYTCGQHVRFLLDLEIPSGSSERHLGSIGETLARVSLPLKPGPFWELLRQERLGMSAQPSGEDIAFCLISSGQSDALLKEAEALSQQCGGLFWICILDPEVERKPIPAGIHFVPVQY